MDEIYRHYKTMLSDCLVGKKIRRVKTKRLKSKQNAFTAKTQDFSNNEKQLACSTSKELNSFE